MASKIRPIQDRLLIQVEEPEKKTKSGLVLPDQVKTGAKIGVVIAAGPGRYEDGGRVPVDVNEGDRVIYSEYAGIDVPGDDDVKRVLINSRDVLAVME